MKRLILYINIPLIIMVIIKFFFVNQNDLIRFILLYITINFVLIIPGMLFCNIIFNARQFMIFELPSLFFVGSLISIFLILSVCFILQLSINAAVILYLLYILVLLIYNLKKKPQINISKTEVDKIDCIYVILIIIAIMVLGFCGSSVTGDPLTHISLIRRCISEHNLEAMTLYPLNGKSFWAGYVYNYWHITIGIISIISCNDPCFVWVNILTYIIIVFFSAQMLLANKILKNYKYVLQLPVFIVLYSLITDVHFNVPAFNLSRLLVPENLNRDILMAVSSYFLIDILECKRELFYDISNKLFFVMTLCVINIIHMNFVIYLGLMYGIYILVIATINVRNMRMLRRCISLGILLVISFIPTLVLNIRYVKQDEISIQKAMQYVIDNNMITYINNQIIVKPQGNLLYLMAILATGIIVFNNKLTIIRKCFLVYSTLAFILINNDMIIHILIKICPIWILWRLPNIIPIWVIVVYLIFAMENIVYQLGNSVKKIDKRVVMLVYSIFFAYIFIQLTKLDYIKMNTYKFMYISIYLLILIYIGIMFGLIVEKYLSINVQKSSISVLVLVVLVSVTDPGKITLEVINKRFISSIVYSSTYGYGPEDIVDGQWDNELIDYINKRIPDHSMIAFSSKGTGEVTICFKNINILSSANATPNEELYVRQIENEKLFNKTTKLEEVKEILGKYKIKYIIITPSFKAAVSMYKDYQKVYSKNGYYIIRIN